VSERSLKLPDVRRSRSPRGRFVGSDDTSESRRLIELVEVLARWLDTQFTLPGVGWRFGLDPLVGLIPGVGDLATTLVAIYIVALAGRCGIPRITVARMAVNVAIDMLVGSLPVVGDLFDFWWKGNRRNAALLKIRLHESPAELRRATLRDWMFVGVVSALLVGLLLVTLVAAAAMAHALWQAMVRMTA
jgi:hypothetical protein